MIFHIKLRMLIDWTPLQMSSLYIDETSEMNVTPGINNHLRSLDLFRSVELAEFLVSHVPLV